MDIATWLDQKRGRAAALAARAKVAQAAVAQWKTSRVPLEFVRLVNEFTGGEVTLEEMLPAPPPMDIESEP